MYTWIFFDSFLIFILSVSLTRSYFFPFRSHCLSFSIAFSLCRTISLTVVVVLGIQIRMLVIFWGVKKNPSSYSWLFQHNFMSLLTNFFQGPIWVPGDSASHVIVNHYGLISINMWLELSVHVEITKSFFSCICSNVSVPSSLFM